MAQEYEASVQPDALPGRPYPRFPDEVSPQSQGAAVGRSIEDVGQVAQGVFERTQRQAQQAQLTDAHNQLQNLSLNLTHDPQNGAFTRQGKDAFNLQQQYLPKFDEQSAAIVAGIPDAKARALASGAQLQMRIQLAEQLDTHEMAQHQKFAVQTAQASVKLAQQAMAANYNHADILATNRDTLLSSIESLGKQQGWSDEEVNQAKLSSLSSAHSDVIDRMLADDRPGMAKHYLNSIKGDMDAHAVYSAERSIDAHLKEKQNEMKQDIADRFSDSMMSASFGLKNPITVTRKEMDILYPKDAQRRWDGLQSMVATGAQAKQYDQMTPDQIRSDLGTRTPTEGGPEAAFQIRNYETLARAAQQSMSARTKDPAQFAIDSGHGWQPINFADPKGSLAQLTSRANTAAQVGQQVGVPVPLLTKPEAATLAAGLDRAPPAQRLRTLAAIHDALPDERGYFDLLHQVLPHSPVTAIVGAKVGTPAPANTPVWYDPKFGTNPADAEHILAGEQLLNPQGDQKPGEKGGFKQGFPMPSEAGGAGLQSYFARNVTDMFRDRPELADAHYSAFRAAYASLAAEKGDLSAQPNRQLMDRAFKMSVGAVHEFNGNHLAVPPGMDPSRFEGLVHNAVARTAESAGAPSDWADRIKGYQLRELGASGSGRYELVQGNAPLVRPDGKGPFVIDVRAQYYPGPQVHIGPEDAARMGK